MRKNKVISVLLLAGLATAIIFYQFGSLPKDLTRDEIEFARLAVKLSHQGYAPYDAYATGHTTLYFYIILASFKLFGLSPLALRFPAAVFGFLNIIGMYVLLRLAFHEGELKLKVPKIKKHLTLESAFLLACLFAATRWHFNFARFSFEATLIIFLEISSLITLLLFEKKKHIAWLVVSALFAGLAYNSYQPGRFFFAIPLLYMACMPRLRNWKNFALFGVIFALLVAPLTIHLAQHPDIRITQQLYFLDPNLTPLHKLAFLQENIVKLFQMFTIRGDVNGLHNYPYKPVLEPFIVVLLVLGLIYGLIRKRTVMHVVFSVYLVIALVPTLLTYPHENPNMLRTVTALPAVMYLCGLGIAYILDLASHKKVRKFAPFVPVIIVLLIVFSALSDLRTYFVFQRGVMNETFEIKDGFAGVYTFMHAHEIPASRFSFPAGELERYERLGE